MRLIQLFMMVIVFVPVHAFSSQYYKIIMRNQSYDQIFISPTPGRCMYTWNVPAEGTSLKRNESILVTIEDKGTIGACKDNDEGKIANWNISGNSIPSGFGFQFKRYTIRDVWLTRISEYNGSALKSAFCENSRFSDLNEFQNCLNFNATNTPEYGVIEIVF